MDHYDIVINGGGAVGLSLLAAIKGKKVLLLEASAQIYRDDQYDRYDRTIVLSAFSRKNYIELGCWDHIEPYCTPIVSVEISVQGRYGTSRLEAIDHQVPALGYTISLRQLEKILRIDCLNKNEISLGSKLTHCIYKDDQWMITFEKNSEIKQIRADLLIGADGQASMVRSKNHIGLHTKYYDEQAIVGVVGVERMSNQAFERFTRTGAIALLPVGQSSAAFIWTLPKTEIMTLLAMDPMFFLEKLQAEFGYRVGAFFDLGPLSCFSLNKTQAALQGLSHPPLLLMGSAALNLHPIGAQGFNAHLADIMRFRVIQQNDASLKDYLQKISLSQKKKILFVDSLANFGLLPHSLKAFSVLAFDTIYPLKKGITAFMMGAR